MLIISECDQESLVRDINKKDKTNFNIWFIFMICGKKYFLFPGTFGLTLFLGLIFLLKLNSPDIIDIINAQSLNCQVRSNSCLSGEVAVLRMSGTTNAHAELATQTNYSEVVCCSGLEGLGADCSGTYATVLKLSGTTNAHVEQYIYTNYTNRACLSLSVPSNYAVYVGYASNCAAAGYQTTLASMSGETNAHIGNPGAYSIKICAKIETAPMVSISVEDGNIDYGIMPADTSKTTIDLSDTQTITNIGNVTVTINIRGQNTGCPWILASTNGVNQYVHQFCRASDVSCASPPTNYTALMTDYQTLYTNVAPDEARQLDLRIITPTESSCFIEQAVDATIQAVQQ